VYSVAFSRDGKYLASGGEDGRVRVWEAESGKQVHSLDNRGTVLCVRFTHDDLRVLSFGEGQASFSWYIKTGIHGNTLVYGKGERAVSGDISANGRYTVYPKENQLLSWKLTGFMSNNGHTHTMAAVITSVVSLGDNARFAFADETGIVRIWHAELNKELPVVKVDKGPVQGLAFHVPSLTLVCGTGKRVAIVRMNRPRPKPTFITGHSGEVTSVAISADGKMIVSGSKDHTVCIWNMQGKELYRFTDEDEVLGVAFDPNGKRVISCGSTIRVWDLSEKIP
jgi:WD40 repeat protein